MPEVAPTFVQFVSAVTGRLVSRWDAPASFFGARRATPEERAIDGEMMVWDEAVVVPLTQQFCARYSRELHNAIRAGDLKKRTADDFAAFLKLDEERELERVKKIEEAQREAEAAAAAAELPGELPPGAGLPQSPDAAGNVLEAPATDEERVEVASAVVEPGGPAETLELPEDSADEAPKKRKKQ